MTKTDLQSALESTPIQDAVDVFFAWLEPKFPAYAPILKAANGVIDFILSKEGL